MEKLSYTEKINGRSIRAVRERYDAALFRHQQAREIKFRGRWITAEAFTNAIVLRFLDLSHEEQSEVLREYVARFERMVEEVPEPAPTPTPVDVTDRTKIEPMIGPKSRGRKKPGGNEAS